MNFRFENDNGIVHFNAQTVPYCCGVSALSIDDVSLRNGGTTLELFQAFLVAITSDKDTIFKIQTGYPETFGPITKEDEDEELKVRMFLLTDIAGGNNTAFCEACELVPTSTTVNPKTNNEIFMWLIESDW